MAVTGRVQIYSGEAMAASLKLEGKRAGGEAGPEAPVNMAKLPTGGVKSTRPVQREFSRTLPSSTTRSLAELDLSASPPLRGVHAVRLAVVPGALPGVRIARQPQRRRRQDRDRRVGRGPAGRARVVLLTQRFVACIPSRLL